VGLVSLTVFPVKYDKQDQQGKAAFNERNLLLFSVENF
jgi:hypothetical protein